MRNSHGRRARAAQHAEKPTRRPPIQAQRGACATAAYSPDWLKRAFEFPIPLRELEAPRAIVFGNQVRTLNHALVMDVVWRCHLLGELHGYGSRNPEHCPSIDTLAAAQRGNAGRRTAVRQVVVGRALARRLECCGAWTLRE
jgi:hypothetical protein